MSAEKAAFEHEINFNPVPLLPPRAVTQTLEDETLEQRIKDQLTRSDIRELTEGNTFETELISAIGHIITNGNREKFNSYLQGSVFYLDIRSHIPSFDPPTPLIKDHVDRYLQDLFAEPEHAQHAQALQNFSESFFHAMSGFSNNIQDAYEDAKNMKDSIHDLLTKRFLQRKQEFQNTEKFTANVLLDPIFTHQSKEKQGAFWEGLINTFYFYKTDEEIRVFENLWVGR